MAGFTDIEIEGSSDYLKLTAGTVVTFHILSHTPEKQVVHWNNKKKVACVGKDRCELCAEGNLPKQRWIVEVWDRKDLKLKKLEFGPAIAGQFKEIATLMAESQQSIHDVDIRVKTTGSGLDTEYSVLHVPTAGVIPQEVKEKFTVPF